jgi:DNA-binding NarL/FixJ family response regulator
VQATTNVVPTRVGLISTEPIRVAGLASVFENHPALKISIGDSKMLLADLTLRYMILDVSVCSDWMEKLSMVRRVRPDIHQIVLGPAGNDEQILRSIIAGARAYLDPNSGPLAVRLAVETVIQGCIWAPRRLLSKIIERLLSQQGTSLPLPSPVLSPRERQVLDLIMTASSNREIAEQLGIEERTVKAYVASLLRKTGAENRVSLSVQATQDFMRDRRVLQSQNG